MDLAGGIGIVAAFNGRLDAAGAADEEEGEGKKNGAVHEWPLDHWVGRVAGSGVAGMTGAGGAAGGVGVSTDAGVGGGAGGAGGMVFQVAAMSCISLRASKRVYLLICVFSSGGGTSTTARAIDWPPRALMDSETRRAAGWPD